MNGRIISLSSNFLSTIQLTTPQRQLPSLPTLVDTPELPLILSPPLTLPKQLLPPLLPPLPPPQMTRLTNFYDNSRLKQLK